MGGPGAQENSPSAVAPQILTGGTACTTMHTFTLALDDITTHTVASTTILLNHERIKTLRMLFRNVVLKEAKIMIHQTGFLSEEFDKFGVIRFGLIPSQSPAATKLAVAKMLPYFENLTLSRHNQNYAAATMMPPGIELDFGTRSIAGGHPVPIIINDGYLGKLDGTARKKLPLVGGMVQLTFECSGTGSATMIDY